MILEQIKKKKKKNEQYLENVVDFKFIKYIVYGILLGGDGFGLASIGDYIKFSIVDNICV